MTAQSDTTLSERWSDAISAICWTVSVVTAQHGDTPHGTTLNAVMLVSEDPPMLLAAVKPQSGILAMIRESGRFGVNTLSHQQSEMALGFAIKEPSERFNGVDWSLEAGVPRLSGASAFSACQLTEIHEMGDRVLVLGSVLGVDTVDQPPLTFYRKTFGTHAPSPRDTD